MQLPAFLNYVVKEELAGRGNKIKAYTVAVDALGRPDSFDPSTDPVIRVIANRLRKALDNAYARDDVEVPVRIELIRGSYRPVFHRVAPPEREPAGRKAARPVSEMAQPAPLRPSRRYVLIISLLSILLALALGYITWHLFNHEHYDATYIGDVPPDLTTHVDPGE